MPREDLPIKPEQFRVGQEQPRPEAWSQQSEREMNEPLREQAGSQEKERAPAIDTGQKKKLGLAALRKTHIQIPSVKDEVAVKIEKILEEGVGDAYNRLSPVAKQEFKIKGEETATAIREMVKSGHAKVKKILRLILDWLKLLPGVNKYYIEQEAKIKTDRIMNFKDKV
jgi:hypothetical protein